MRRAWSAAVLFRLAIAAKEAGDSGSWRPHFSATDDTPVSLGGDYSGQGAITDTATDSGSWGLGEEGSRCSVYNANSSGCRRAGISSTSCRIDRVPWGSLGMAEFGKNYVSKGRPVFFSNATKEFNARPQLWNQDEFLRQFGDVRVRVGTGADISQFGGRTDDELQLRDVVRQFGVEDNPDDELCVFDMEAGAHLSHAFTQPSIFADTFMVTLLCAWLVAAVSKSFLLKIDPFL